MTLRLTTLSRQWLFRLRKSVCYRCLSNKEENGHFSAAHELIEQLSIQRKCQLINYINSLNKDQDKRLKDCQSMMDKVHTFMTKSGPLKSLEDLVKVVGLSPDEASALCEELAGKMPKRSGRIKYTYPLFTPQDSKSVESLLAIHTSLYCITWAHMDRFGRIRSWQKQPLPLKDHERHPIDCVQAVMSIYDKIPLADAYIFEAPTARRPKDSVGALNTALLANINSSLLSIVTCAHARAGTQARLYYMHKNLVPLLFGLSVGGEIVCRLKIVEELINNPNPNRKEYSNIVLDSWLVDLFTKSKNCEMEELSIPLLSAIAAMEVLVRRNPQAIAKIERF